MPIRLPCIGGHEGAGVVTAVGDHVSWVAPGEHGHARGHAERRGAVDILEEHATRGEAVQVRRPRERRVPACGRVAAGDVRAVLVGEDVEQVWSPIAPHRLVSFSSTEPGRRDTKTPGRETEPHAWASKTPATKGSPGDRVFPSEPEDERNTGDPMRDIEAACGAVRQQPRHDP